MKRRTKRILAASAGLGALAGGGGLARYLIPRLRVAKQIGQLTRIAGRRAAFKGPQSANLHTRLAKRGAVRRRILDLF